MKQQKILFDLVIEISEKTGSKNRVYSISGGESESPINLKTGLLILNMFQRELKKAYENKIVKKNLDPLKIVMECGRMVTGPYGYLVSRVLHKKETYKNYVGLDSCMANLMRPALYGAYHHITNMNNISGTKDHVYDVTGSLCENNDKFAVNRNMVQTDIGDTIVIHETGAHGYAMGFNYNGKLRSAELLLQEDGSVKQIRRAETVEDLFCNTGFFRTIRNSILTGRLQ